jgi:uncharacterized protein
MGQERQIEAGSLNQLLIDLAGEYARALTESLGGSLFAVVLFGSVARGEATPHSDIDLFVVASGLPSGRFARTGLLDEADARIQSGLDALRQQGVFSDVSPILKTPEEASGITPLYLDMVEDAVILFEQDGFFSAIQDRVRRSLNRLGSRRRVLGRTRYWELKPDYTPGEIFEL